MANLAQRHGLVALVLRPRVSGALILLEAAWLIIERRVADRVEQRITGAFIEEPQGLR